MPPVTFLIIGAGSRGRAYSQFAIQHPDKAQVVSVAEPREFWRNTLAEQHNIPPSNVFAEWREAAELPGLADAVVISTPDASHLAPAIAMSENGYHILLEKPMAPTAAGCREIVHAVEKSGTIFAVAHVLRYTTYTRMLKEILESGAIGDVVSVDHLEPIGYWHFAHSFVRGQWRNESLSSPLLLSKSCHDLDWLRYIVGSPCKKVSSFGGLCYFQPAKKPTGAAQRCLDCPIEQRCPYSAKRFYLGRVRHGQLGWPVDVITSDLTEQGVTKALQTGPYGRCVWSCDNDVADHQVVNLEFEAGQTASFTVTAFTESRHRQTRIYGTSGEIRGDGNNIEMFDFLTNKTKTMETNVISDGGILSGHGGGDYAIMDAFTRAVATNDTSSILSGPGESLETHIIVFAAEKSRCESRVVAISELSA